MNVPIRNQLKASPSTPSPNQKKKIYPTEFKRMGKSNPPIQN